MILFRDEHMEFLGWERGAYGLIVVLIEKIIYPRIVPSYNMPGETGCYTICISNGEKEIVLSNEDHRITYEPIE